MKKLILFPSLLGAFAALVAVLFSGMTTAQETSPAPATTGPDIIAVVTANPKLTTLTSALRAAELVEMLQGRGPFTLFAPDNAAFAKLPAGTLESLMMPGNKKKLAAILKNHVIRDKVVSADIKGDKSRTLAGGRVELRKNGGKIFFGDATVVIADMDASNGVIHVIDTVVMPD